MATFYKEFEQKDIQKFVLPQKNPTITINSAANATTNNVDVFSIGALTGSVKRPDFYGATTSNISRSGAMNHIAMFFYNRYIDTYYDVTKNIYTIPRVDTSASSCTLARVIQVSDPTKDQGIYPDTFQCTVWFNGSSAVAIDTVSDSLGVNKESLNYGYLVDRDQPTMKVGTIFYDYGLVVLHGGTGNVWSYTHTYQTDSASADINYKVSFDTGKINSPELVITNMTFNTMKIIARNIYYCRATHDEFNYTTNPSAQGVDFLQRDEQATTYISTIGLYNEAGELLALAKVNPPYKKNKYTEAIFQVIIDF